MNPLVTPMTTPLARARGGPYSNGHKQDENASIDEITDCAKIAALLYMRTLSTSSA